MAVARAGKRTSVGRRLVKGCGIRMVASEELIRGCRVGYACANDGQPFREPGRYNDFEARGIALCVD